MALTTNTYYSQRLHRTFRHGDSIIIQGQTYTSAYKEGYGYNYTEATTKVFYGVYENPNTTATAPLCVADDYGNPQYFFDDSIIIGGGTLDTYKVTFNANGGSGAPAPQTKEYGYAIKLSTDTPSRTGYTFVGWGTSSDDTSVNYYPGDLFGMDEDTTLYAIWQINTYTVKYNANGGSGAPDAQVKTHGVDLTLSSKKPTKSGYDFAGWATSASGSVAYAAGAKYTANKSVTLYAVYTIKKYKVAFNASENGGTPDTEKTVNHESKIGTFPADPKKPFYKFVGWFTSPTGGTRISESQVITADVTYYAQFKIDATVKIISEGVKNPAIAWVWDNGTWVKCVVWVGSNGVWHKSTGAD